MLCACDSNKNYDDCCKLYIDDGQLPDTAEKLMRSRYTAFTQANIEYLKKTLAPESRKDFDPKATKEWAEKSKWKGLKIISTTKGGPEDNKGVVEFMATYELNREAIDHHEVSDFRKDETGRWFFVDGESHLHKEGEDHHHHHQKPQTVVREEPKIGRNDPCPCGSGKKYKKCHGSE